MTVCVIDHGPTHHTDRGLVCDNHRRRLDNTLRDIGELYQRIDIMPGRGGSGGRPTGKPGSRLPLAVDALDLTMPARTGAVTDGIDPKTERPYGDQHGHLSVASVLDTWVRDWREVRDRGEGLPVPTVPVLVAWLRNRVEWACDEHPAVDEFCSEMEQVKNAMRRTVGDYEARLERLWTPCGGCDQLALNRTPGDDYPIRCANCGQSYTEEEHMTRTKLYAAAAA